MSKAIVIDYYTDVLCVWAWIAQPRLEELERQWQGQVEVRHRYLDIFGNAHPKIRDRWGTEDGFANFSTHVREAVGAYPEIDVNPGVWLQQPPTTSLAAHLYIKAAQTSLGREEAEKYALAIRHAFFLDARDIGHTETLLELAAGSGIAPDALQGAIADGTALAALSADLRDAAGQHVHGSPTCH